jgi:hypothetical protein
MKQPLVVAAVCSFLLAACATQPAPGISGRWKPVNHFASSIEAIPLHPAYEFYASPLDGTLKTLLLRWALDSKMTLAYEAASDFTLYAPVARIRTADLRQATDALTALYANEHIVVMVEGDSIVVRPVPANAPHNSVAAALPSQPAAAAKP